MDQPTKNNSRTLIGTVVSDKMQKTVVVEIQRLKKHAKYQKYQKVSSRYHAHSPENQYHVGDRVVMQETRPLSKNKHWVVMGKVSGQ